MQDFEHFVIERFAGFANKFRKKHAQYQGRDTDELANFRIGARLKYGRAGLPEMYETAKDYCRKHVAYIESHGIDGNTVNDSLEDIAVYAVIMLYMRYRMKKEREEKEKVPKAAIPEAGRK